MDKALKASLAAQIKDKKATPRRQALRVTLMNELGDPGYPAWSIIWYMPRGQGNGKGSGHRPYGPRSVTNWFTDIDQAIQAAKGYIKARRGLQGCELEIERAVEPAMLKAPVDEEPGPLA